MKTNRLTMSSAISLGRKFVTWKNPMKNSPHGTAWNGNSCFWTTGKLVRFIVSEKGRKLLGGGVDGREIRRLKGTSKIHPPLSRPLSAPSIPLPLRLSSPPPAHHSVCPSAPPVHLSVHPSLLLDSTVLHLAIRPFVRLPFCPSSRFSPSVHLSARPSLSLSLCARFNRMPAICLVDATLTEPWSFRMVHIPEFSTIHTICLYRNEVLDLWLLCQALMDVVQAELSHCFPI